LLSCHQKHYNAVRPHLALKKDAPISLDVERAGPRQLANPRRVAPPVRPGSSRRQGQRKEVIMIDRRTAPFAAFILRLTLSFLFSAHLYRKYAFTGYDVWFNGWVQAGLPAWTLYYTVAAEFAGASLLLLGVYTRYVALFALPVIIAVAQLWATRRGFWFSDGGVEFPLAWTAMLIAQALLGDGAFALKTPVLPWERSTRLPA
jgi:putative oxidoreductase